MGVFSIDREVPASSVGLTITMRAPKKTTDRG
jgi:hypothetical protein